MAIVKTTQSDTFGPVPGVGIYRTPIALPFNVAVTTGMIDNANDEVGLLWVPKGFVVLGIAFDTTDMDSSTGLLWDVGDDGAENRLLAAFSGQSAGRSVALPAGGLLYKYTAKTLIKAYVNTAASGTPAAGTIKGFVLGLVDEEFSTTALVAY
jgi:hypothetical protein